jgi:valyl-tRNA synthetase
METGADIIFFWVAKMIMLGLYRTGQVPFHTVYLHGMVRDDKHQKMSKSKGNVISPVEVAERFGTDALRMALVVGNTPGTDMALSEDKIKAYKLFANKLWNVARFILSNVDLVDTEVSPQGARGLSSVTLTEVDQKLSARVNALLQDITADLDNYRFHLASDKLYHYVWDELASNILEESKTIFAGESPASANAPAGEAAPFAEASEAKKASRQQFLLTTLKKILIALHPFMPFITEEIWQELGSPSLLMIEPWPVVKEF